MIQQKYITEISKIEGVKEEDLDKVKLKLSELGESKTQRKIGNNFNDLVFRRYRPRFYRTI